MIQLNEKALKNIIKQRKETIKKLQTIQVNPEQFLCEELDTELFKGPVTEVIGSLERIASVYGPSSSLTVWSDYEASLHIDISYKLGEHRDKLEELQLEREQHLQLQLQTLANEEQQLAELQSKLAVEVPAEVKAWIKQNPERAKAIVDFQGP